MACGKVIDRLHLFFGQRHIRRKRLDQGIVVSNIHIFHILFLQRGKDITAQLHPAFPPRELVADKGRNSILIILVKHRFLPRHDALLKLTVFRRRKGPGWMKQGKQHPGAKQDHQQCPIWKSLVLFHLDPS